MLLAIWIRLVPSMISRNVDQLKTCNVSQATTPPSMTGTKVACKNGTRIALSHNPMKGGLFASTLGLDDIEGSLSISKTALAGDDIRLIPESAWVKGQKAKACSKVRDRLLAP